MKLDLYVNFHLTGLDFSPADMLACAGRKITCHGSALLKGLSQPWQGNSEPARTVLKIQDSNLRQLNWIQPSLNKRRRFFSCGLMLNCLWWKKKKKRKCFPSCHLTFIWLRSFPICARIGVLIFHRYVVLSAEWKTSVWREMLQNMTLINTPSIITSH